MCVYPCTYYIERPASSDTATPATKTVAAVAKVRTGHATPLASRPALGAQLLGRLHSTSRQNKAIALDFSHADAFSTARGSNGILQADHTHTQRTRTNYLRTRIPPMPGFAPSLTQPIGCQPHISRLRTCRLCSSSTSLCPSCLLHIFAISHVLTLSLRSHQDLGIVSDRSRNSPITLIRMAFLKFSLGSVVGR